ncbi:MAG: DNA-binding protein [Candidatus Bathyarchaeota archaeon]|nr:DNA-binding protein [Candidatus Bathyarchaeota archaeon]
MSASTTKKTPLKVILDSNAFFVPLKFKIDIFEELKQLLNRNVEYVLLSPVKHELELLTQKEEPKLQREAGLALRFAEKCQLVPVEDCKEATDDVIVRVAKKWNSPVFTNDRILKKRLRDISVPVIYVRQKSRLDIDGLIS